MRIDNDGVGLEVAVDGPAGGPAVLFLHGLFEGGNDGTTATSVGLGPAVKEHPERFRSIIVFAQTSHSWRDDDELPLAMATLDDAQKNFGIDRGRPVRVLRPPFGDRH